MSHLVRHARLLAIDYTPMFSKSIDDDPERTTIRDAYLDGTKTWVGDRY